MNVKNLLKEDNIKIFIMVILLLAACFFTFYFHIVLKRGTIFTHFFYVPVILSSLWWKRKGFIITILLVIVLILSHFLLRSSVESLNDLLGVPILILVAIITIFLTEKIVGVNKILCEKNDYLEKFVDYANVPIIVWDNKGNISRCNTAFENLTQYKSFELVGEHFTTIFNGGTDKKVLREIEQTLEDKYLDSVETTIRGKFGKEVIILWNSANVYSSDGKNIIATIAQGQDITKRKQTESKLKKYQAIVESAYDAIFFKDLEGHYIIRNSKALEYLELSKDDIIGKTEYEIIDNKVIAQNSVDDDHLVISTGKTKEIIKSKIDKNGKELWYQVVKVPMIDQDGEITGLVGIARDITKLKLAEVEIKKERNFSKNIVATIPEILLVIDVDLKIKSVNRSFYDLFDIGPEKVIGTPITEILGVKDERLVGKLIDLFGTDDIIDEFEVFYESKKFGHKILKLIARSIIIAEEEEEEEEEELIILQDITEQKRVEEKLLKFNEELELKVRERTVELNRKIKEIEQQKTAILNLSNDLEYKNIELLSEIAEKQRAEKIQKVLYNISNALNTTNKLYDLYGKIREFLGDIIDTTNFYVALYNEESNLISFGYYADETFSPKDYIPSARKFGKGLTEYVIKTNKPLLASKQYQDGLAKQGEIEIIRVPSKIWLGVPLKIDNSVIGVIAVQSYRESNLYQEKDIEILNFVSDEIAVVINRKQALEQLKRELKENKVLLREIHHRTKNNLQTICSLLQLQQNAIRSKDDAIKSLIVSRDRIRAMAQAYEILLQADYMSIITLDNYLISLIEQLKRNYDIHHKIDIHYSLEKVYFDTEKLSKIGLIMNELITNAIKHAFVGKDQGNIHITLKDSQENIKIIVSDDGIGISKNVKIQNPTTLGLSLVDMLLSEFNGTYSIDKNNGTTITLLLPKKLDVNYNT